MTRFVSKSPSLITSCDNHSHDCWEIVIPTKGEGILETKYGSIPFDSDCVYVVPPHLAHSSYSENGFSDIYIHTDYMKLSTNQVTIIHGISELSALGTIILDAYLKKDQGLSGSMEYSLKLITQIIYDHLEKQNRSLTACIRDFLIDNLSDASISMETLSQQFGYNGDYIRRIFKADFCVTPMEYLDELRLSQAKELLQNMPVYKIDEVAELCGFTDPFYFSRFFKKHAGVSPREFKTKVLYQRQ